MQFVRILRFVMALRTLSRLCWCHGWSRLDSRGKSRTSSNIKLWISKGQKHVRNGPLLNSALSWQQLLSLTYLIRDISFIMSSSFCVLKANPDPTQTPSAYAAGQDAGRIHLLHSEIVVVGAFALASHCVSRTGGNYGAVFFVICRTLKHCITILCDG